VIQRWCSRIVACQERVPVHVSNEERSVWCLGTRTQELHCVVTTRWREHVRDRYRNVRVGTRRWQSARSARADERDRIHADGKQRQGIMIQRVGTCFQGLQGVVSERL